MVLTELSTYNKAQKPIFYLGLFLSAISAVLALLPMVTIWLGVSELFWMYPNFQVTDKLEFYAFLAVGTAIATILVYGMPYFAPMWGISRGKKHEKHAYCQINGFTTWLF